MNIVFHLLLCVAVGSSVLAEEALGNEVDRQARRPSSCSYAFYGNRGVIQSPNYPANYNNNADCRWDFPLNIRFPYRMKVYFCDFEVEKSVFGGCADSVKIAGNELCGNRKGQSQTYDVKLAFSVRFRTDSRTTKKGFKIAYCADCYDFSAVKALCADGLTSPATPRTTTRRGRTTTPRTTTRRGRTTTRRRSTTTTRGRSTTSSRFTYPRF